VVDFVSKTAQLNGKKVVAINPAESMNINAANALLKCLEEPSGDTVLILLSHAPHRLLPTIKSRCQTLLLEKPSNEAGLDWLTTFVADQQVRDKVFELASGNPLLALEYYEDDTLGFYQECLKNLGRMSQYEINPVGYAEEILKKDPVKWLQICQKILWDLIKSSNAIGNDELGQFSVIYQKEGFQKKAFKFLEEIQTSLNEMTGPTNPNPQLLIESITLRWQALLR
jgi:DNA polymerase-3 subunit delta'